MSGVWRAFALYYFCLHCATLVFADEQFNCPNNGKPKTDDAGKSIQCLPGQASAVICGAGYSCYFSGFNYQCCPTNDDEEDVEHSRDGDSNNDSHRRGGDGGGEEELTWDRDSLNGRAECPDDTFTVLDHSGTPVPCHPRSKPCPEKSMFCNKFSPIPVCCESVGPRKMSPSSPPPSSLLSPQDDQKSHEQPTVGASSSVAASAGGAHAANESGLTTLVNRDMGIDGECSANSVLVLSDAGRPIACDRNHPCPLDSLLCNRANNGRSYCCQIVPRDEIGRSHQTLPPLSSLTASSTPSPPLPPPSTSKSSAAADSKKRVVGDELRAPQPELAAAHADSSPLPPHGGLPPSSHPSDSDLLGDGGSPPAAQPPATNAANGDNPPPPKFAGAFVDNEEKDARGAKLSGGITSIRVVAHASKTHPGEKSEKAVEYRPHSQGGYAVLKKLERANAAGSGAPLGVEDEETRKRLAQRFLLDQIKSGWPYDERFYRSENVVVMSRGSRPAAIVHFPN